MIARLRLVDVAALGNQQSPEIVEYSFNFLQGAVENNAYESQRVARGDRETILTKRP